MNRVPTLLGENAVALTLVGISAGWMALNMGRRLRARERSGPDGRAVALSREVRHLVAEYPIMVGAVAVATGVGIALALPETEVEARVIGPVARRVADGARGLADHVRADMESARELADP